MVYSHPFNALAQLVWLGVGFGVSVGLIWLLNQTPIGPDVILKSGKQPLAQMAYYLAAVGGMMWLTWKLVYQPYLVPATNWLYLKVFRKTTIPWNDCVRLSPLFVGGKNFRWYPADELPKIPEEDRVQYLYQVAEKTGLLIPPKDSEEMVRDMERQNHPVDMPEPEKRPELSERGVGIVMIICGLGIAYISILSPLKAAAHHADSISTYLAGAFITPLALAMGITYAIFGDKAARVLGLRHRPTPLGWTFMIVFGAIGVLLYLWLKAKLRMMGYA